MYQDRLRRLSGGKPYNPVAPIIEGIRLAHRNYPTAHPTLWDGLLILVRISLPSLKLFLSGFWDV